MGTLNMEKALEIRQISTIQCVTKHPQTCILLNRYGNEKCLTRHIEITVLSNTYKKTNLQVHQTFIKGKKKIVYFLKSKTCKKKINQNSMPGNIHHNVNKLNQTDKRINQVSKHQ